METLTTHAALALEAARLHRQAQELGRRDALTGLLNRRQLDADIAEEGRRGNRYDRPWTFVLCDVDHFKSLNDQHGHLFGDEVLRDVAVTLRDGFRDTDAAYRYAAARSSPCCCVRLTWRLRPPWSSGCNRPSSSASRGMSPAA